MVKIASSTPGVFLVGPAGKERPWCGKCHKFLKSETAAHDCTPAHLSHRSGGSQTGARKRIRLSPKTKNSLDKVFRSAAREMALAHSLGKLSQATKDKSILKAAKSLIKKMKDPKAPASKKYKQLTKRFF